MKTVLRSHVGKVRQVNEDKAWSGRLAGGLTVAIVADGMGGHRAGDVASAMAVDSLVQSLQAVGATLTVASGAEALREMVREANRAIFETASLNDQYHNMGTTVVVALLDGSSGIIAHIGDSRAYRLRAGRLEQLTEDHTLVNELTKSGQISAEEAARHPRRNVLTRALGTDQDVKADIDSIDWHAGDVLLLCSDGLSGLVESTDMSATIGETNVQLEQRAQKLIDLAMAAGGDDNITVVLVTDDDGWPSAAGGETA
ncbi:Stp1/IreP family PP2C-type Ser/Thr phosphatase [Cohnella soli]|uniref:Stp1/IreP family PP2C-type Ser/Thr phosphatase n=1 Tax=Cohnella soli TaxID=425005 RepID=A0ABW0HS47_9BACL